MPSASEARTGRSRVLPPVATVTVAALGLLTLVGTGTAHASAPASSQPNPKSAQLECVSSSTGPYQLQVERHLGRQPDGIQSVRDCLAIQSFQQREGITTTGIADPATYRMTVVAKARANPGVGTRCPVRRGRVACVDQTRQLMWVQKGKRVVFPVTPVRTGLKAYKTRNGWHRIFFRKLHETSRLYNNAPMPYSQYFSGGQAFHGTRNDIFTKGSAGCVNLRIPDAARLWKVLHKKDRAYIFGHRPALKRNGAPRPS